MIEWQGIAADTADVDETSGVSALQLNTRMRIDGELQRRYGMLSTGLPPLDGPVLYIASGSGFVVRGTATNVEGNPDPVDIPVGPIRRPPIIDVIRQGGGWVIPYQVFSTDGIFYVAGSCSGSVQSFIGNSFQLVGTRYRNAPPFDSYIFYNQFVTGGQTITIPVPFDDQFLQFSITYGLSTLEGQSTPGCAI
jgi:hypothetical protein